MKNSDVFRLEMPDILDRDEPERDEPAALLAAAFEESAKLQERQEQQRMKNLLRQEEALKTGAADDDFKFEDIFTMSEIKSAKDRLQEQEHNWDTGTNVAEKAAPASPNWEMKPVSKREEWRELERANEED